MRALQRTTLSLALTLAPMIGTGCISTAPRFTHSRTIQQRDQKMNTARLEESRGNLESCKTLYEEIYLQNPCYADCIHRLAVVSTRLNRHNEAEAYFQQANNLKPNDAEILADMGYAAFMRKDYVQSETLLEQSIRLNGTDRRIVTNLAIVQAWRLKDDASLTNFRRVKAEPDALRSLAAIQIARGDSEKGARLYELASAVKATGAPSNQVITQASASDGNSRYAELPPSPSLTIPPSPEPRTLAAPESPPPATFTAPTFNTIPVLPPPVRVVNLAQAASADPEPATLAPPVPIANPDSCTRVAPPEFYPDRQPPAASPPIPPDASPLPPDVNSSGLYQAPAPSRRLVHASTTAPVAQGSYEVTGIQPSEITIPADLESERDEEPRPLVLNAQVMLPPIVAAQSIAPETRPKIDPQPEQMFHKPSVWRKTLASRGGPPDEIPVVFESVSVVEPTIDLPRVEEKTSVWNVCLVTLLEEKRLAPTRPEFSMEYMSHQYCFATANALEKFRATPHMYAPVAGGLDIVSVRNERSVVEGSLNFALWYHKRLYLFSSREHAESFRREPQKYASMQ